MSVVDESAHVVREYRGVNANVLVFEAISKAKDEPLSEEVRVVVSGVE